MGVHSAMVDGGGKGQVILPPFLTPDITPRHQSLSKSDFSSEFVEFWNLLKLVNLSVQIGGK